MPTSQALVGGRHQQGDWGGGGVLQTRHCVHAHVRHPSLSGRRGGSIRVTLERIFFEGPYFILCYYFIIILSHPPHMYGMLRKKDTWMFFSARARAGHRL